jgi:hypothetical protein
MNFIMQILSKSHSPAITQQFTKIEIDNLNI